MPSFGDLNRVNTNIQSLDSQYSLNRINSDIAENQLKMSTGKRINRAEDDSAGYSIATKLRSRVGGLNQAMQNVGDAKSVLDIAEASYSTVMDSLVEMKSLATQAANDSLGDTERGFIGDQIEALGDDINEVANQTVYQDYELLNGEETGMTGSLSLEFQVGERKSDTITTSINAVNVGELFNQGGGATANLGATGSTTAIQADSASTSGSGQGGLTFASTATSADYREFISAVDSAINTMSENVNDIGITQSSLSVREETLSQSISANEAAKSRIMDTDFAKAQSESVRLQILQQTATSSLAQANNGPQSVLGFIG
ncbi:flagellin [Aliifodinibius sp. S!AR15-10]|uniref:flagellin n=1 Tax=Aliifodinibius sp. S!AR15-10 TaxID=2950437 RepID=UPI00285465D9|nr:flagellin [Aliifodinibius sp. S!AR15-10]MDR8393043.1 flagellin [Aliifodinibius sp. S!AR15-10]